MKLPYDTQEEGATGADDTAFRGFGGSGFAGRRKEVFANTRDGEGLLNFGV